MPIGGGIPKGSVRFMADRGFGTPMKAWIRETCCSADLQSRRSRRAFPIFSTTRRVYTASEP